MPVLFGLSLAFSVALCIHIVRTGQQTFWLWVVLGLQPLGGVVYLLAVVLPGASDTAAVRRIKQSAIDRIDPTRAYRQAQEAFADAPTVANRMRLATAASAHGREQEALEIMDDLDRRLAKTNAHFRAEARHWRDFAAAELRLTQPRP